MLTPYLPYPPSSGGQIRSYNLIKHLSKKHDITLYSLIKSDSEKKDISELKKYCKKVRVFTRSSTPFTFKNILLTGFGSYPFLVIRNLVTTEKKALAKELTKEKYDLIHAECFYVMPHIPKTKTPILLVDQTIEYLVYKHYVNNQAPVIARPLFSVDVLKLKYWERKFWRKASRVVAVSETDKKEMKKLEPKLNVEIIPNGVDLDFFLVKKSWDVKKPVILFVANFKWLQNTEAAILLIDRIFPLINKKHKQAKVWIVGQHVPESIKNRQKESVVVSDLDVDDQDGIKKAYYNSTLFISPLRGPGGTRLKHFAALASKLPLITTRVGAEGMLSEDNKSLYVRDDPNKIAEIAIELLNSPDRIKKIADNARKFVEETYSWEVIAQQLSDIYEETASHQP